MRDATILAEKYTAATRSSRGVAFQPAWMIDTVYSDPLLTASGYRQALGALGSQHARCLYNDLQRLGLSTISHLRLMELYITRAKFRQGRG